MSELSPCRVVLDTNVILDLFLFQGLSIPDLKQALAMGKIQCMTSEACLAELQRVLGYPDFKLDSEQAQTIYENYCRVVTLYPVQETPCLSNLPRCKDEDDQKFLILSRVCKAKLLITKDKALLRLAKKAARQEVFKIIRPDKVAVFLNEA